MRYLIDSNIWIYAAAGVDCVIQFMNSADLDEWIGYSSISRLEVMGYKDFDEGQEGKMKKMLSCFNECEISASIRSRNSIAKTANYESTGRNHCCDSFGKQSCACDKERLIFAG